MNWNLPTLTSLYTDVIDLMKERTEDVATMFQNSTSTNLPIDTIRWNKANSRLEKYSGSSWIELDALYEMKVRESTKLSTARTIAISGDATGSTTFDGTANKTISLSLTASQVLAKLKTVDTNTSGLNAQYLQGNEASLFYRQQSDIGSSIDLDTIILSGWYHQNSSANAVAGANYPENAAGLLEVHADGNMVYQRYTIYISGDVYTRVKYRSAWNAWQNLDNTASDILSKIKTVDGSGSGLDADLLDGKQATAFNQVIGTDSDMNTSGATIPDRFSFTDGVCTSHGTRTLTASDIGAVYIVAQSLGINGYRKWSDGFIEQWGRIYTGSQLPANTKHTVTFPIAFPSECLNAQTTGGTGYTTYSFGTISNSDTSATNYSGVLPSKTTMYIKTPNTSYQAVIFWTAIGY